MASDGKLARRNPIHPVSKSYISCTRGDSMILTFQVSPLASGRGLCYIESWYGGIRPIFRQIGKLELSV